MLKAIKKKLRNSWNTKNPNTDLYFFLIIFTVLLGLLLRLHSIEFGLPHSFHADEPEIVELAIKYTYELRKILANNNSYRLIPISFVYGMFPTYVLTLFTMAFSKTANLIGLALEKMDIYVFLRTVTALTSLIIIPAVIGLYKAIFKERKGWEVLLLTFLVSFNWKFIVHAHYVNTDIYLAVLLSLASFFLIKYFYNPEKSLHVILSGITFGLCFGTKITALVSLPWFLYIFLAKKDYRSFFAFLFLSYIAFALSNPFSLIFAQDFVFRILEMRIKEAGIVFDSVNLNSLKYFNALIFITTPLIFVFSLYGKLAALLHIKNKEKIPHFFLIGQVLTYLLFFSFNAREVTRWLLPIIPFVLIYAVEGISKTLDTLGKKEHLKRVLLFSGLILGLFHYLYYPLLLVKQFNRHTPKSAAYEWIQDNLPPKANKLAITEEGLDPLNKLQDILVIRPKVYTTENAQFDFPPSPIGYDYVILSSKPMQNYKRKEVQENYPYYAKAWEDFEYTVTSSELFILKKEFVLPKPNLAHLSDVYIYESTQPSFREN